MILLFHPSEQLEALIHTAMPNLIFHCHTVLSCFLHVGLILQQTSLSICCVALVGSLLHSSLAHLKLLLQATTLSNPSGFPRPGQTLHLIAKLSLPFLVWLWPLWVIISQGSVSLARDPREQEFPYCCVHMSVHPGHRGGECVLND